ncbi:unnamed protein product [Diamesa hyperborea]
MLRLVFLSCLVALALGGAIPDRNARIVGGSSSSINMFTYQISLRTTTNEHFCGGFVISAFWVGSAAHCTIDRTPATMVVVSGALSRSFGGITVRVAQIVNHPEFDAITDENDISVIRTATNVGISNDQVSVIPLGSIFIGAGVNAVVTGWGQTSNPGLLANTLQWATLTTITNDDCRSRFGASNAAKVFDSNICTFTRAGQGICNGDGGGPLVANGQLIGVVSWGIPCALGSPDVFSRISSYRSWMMSVTG